jgi:hypothetical protein
LTVPKVCHNRDILKSVSILIRPRIHGKLTLALMALKLLA